MARSQEERMALRAERQFEAQAQVSNVDNNYESQLAWSSEGSDGGGERSSSSGSESSSGSSSGSSSD